MPEPATIAEEDLIGSVAEALQLISFTHPADFIRHLAQAWRAEASPAAKNALAQILINSRMARLGRRPICQDTGVVNVFVEMGLGTRITGARTLQELVDEGVRRAYGDLENPLRASMVSDPLFARTPTGDNTPAMVHVEATRGHGLRVSVAAKGGGSENKAAFANLLPQDDVAAWVVATVEQMGAGWCPPGVLGVGVGGSAEKAMLMAKQAALEPLDMMALLARGPATRLEQLRVDLYHRLNALGVGAQGLGGLTTVLDVKISTCPTHAASLPVALVPNCAATRHVSFDLAGQGPAVFEVPDLKDWPDVVLAATEGVARRIDLDHLNPADIADWRLGETLLLRGHLLTARDAAHRRFAALLATGEPLPVPLDGRVIYYVGPVQPVGEEVVGPAGPTTASRMDGFLPALFEHTGLLATIGKGERGAGALDSFARHGRVSLVAVGGAAYLVSKAIRSARVVAFPDLGMEAVHEFRVEDMPVTVAVDARGQSVHRTGPAAWRRAIAPGRAASD